MSLTQRVLDKLGFTKKTLIHFIVISMSSQFIYSINALRTILYDPFRETMGISNTQMGFLFSVLGLVGLFAYIPGTWVTDRPFAREVLNLSLDKKLILFGALFATSDTRKGFHLLQQALTSFSEHPQHPAAELVVFGASRPQNPPSLGLPVHYLGHIHDDYSLALLYSASDVMVVPSLQESFGQTASEALACGTPVVAFDATGLKDIVDHRKNGYLAIPYEAEDLARGIRWVIEDEKRSDALSRQGRQKVLDTFSLAHQAAAYTDLYHALSAQHRS